jgi:hypothetical protein
MIYKCVKGLALADGLIMTEGSFYFIPSGTFCDKLNLLGVIKEQAVPHQHTKIQKVVDETGAFDYTPEAEPAPAPVQAPEPEEVKLLTEPETVN